MKSVIPAIILFALAQPLGAQDAVMATLATFSTASADQVCVVNRSEHEHFFAAEAPGGHTRNSHVGAGRDIVQRVGSCWIRRCIGL